MSCPIQRRNSKTASRCYAPQANNRQTIFLSNIFLSEKSHDCLRQENDGQEDDMLDPKEKQQNWQSLLRAAGQQPSVSFPVPYLLVKKHPVKALLSSFGVLPLLGFCYGPAATCVFLRKRSFNTLKHILQQPRCDEDCHNDHHPLRRAFAKIGIGKIVSTSRTARRIFEHRLPTVRAGDRAVIFLIVVPIGIRKIN